MKLQALRLREVGRFSAPVQIDGFSGGLDVLVAPNESGKSTLLKALKAVFFDKHTAAGQKLSSLQPYSGGAPLIEVDFEAKGGSWRLRKQFLSDRGCSLTELATGRVVARGEDAHLQSLELFGAGADSKDTGVAGFLLLEQKEWLEANPSAKAQTAIESVLQSELASVAGLSRLRFVLAAAREDLAKLLTPQQQRPTGALKASLDRRDGLRARLAEARHKEVEAATRQEKLAALAAERAAHNDPTKIAEHQARARDSVAALEAAQKARDQLARAESAYRQHEAAHKLAAGDAARAKQQLVALDALEKALSQNVAGLSAAENVLQSRLADAAEAQSKFDAATAKADSARKVLDARHRADRRTSQEVRLAELVARVQRISTLETAQSGIAEELRLLPATELTLAAAEAAARAMGEIEARIAAGAPELSFELLPGASGKVRVGGVALGRDQVIKVARPLRVDIEGIGSFTVVPAQTDDSEADAADLAAHRKSLNAILARAGVSDIAALRSILDRRRQLERELNLTRSKIEAEAPHGTGAFQSQIAALREALQSTDTSTSPLPERAAAEAAVANAERELRDNTGEQARAREAVFRAREEVGRLKAEGDASRRQRSALEAALPAAADRATWLDGLLSRLAEVERLFNEATIERSAWRNKTPDAEACRRLADAKSAAELEQKRWSQRREQLDREIAVLDSMLEVDREAGYGEASESLAQDLVVAEREVGMQEADAAALKLLIDAGSEVERSARDALMRPVLERVADYMHLVLPEAVVDLKAGLIVSGLSRSGRSEDINALSQGTREQIALLVRLAVAKLMADSGSPRPFILDDVLVYSDDRRMNGMFENLRRAARHHQVIVLSCRARAFEELGGNRLSITPWHPQ